MSRYNHNKFRLEPSSRWPFLSTAVEHALWKIQGQGLDRRGCAGGTRTVHDGYNPRRVPVPPGPQRQGEQDSTHMGLTLFLLAGLHTLLGVKKYFKCHLWLSSGCTQSHPTLSLWPSLLFLSPLFTQFQPHRPPCSSTQPQGLCTGCSLCLEGSSPDRPIVLPSSPPSSLFSNNLSEGPSLMALASWATSPSPTSLSFIVVVQLLSCVGLIVTPWTAAHQASLSFTISRSCSNSYSLSLWCHPTISSSVTLFSSCPQSFPGSGSFPMSRLFASVG